MKNTVIVILGLLLTLTTACRKDPQPLMERFDLSRENFTIGTTTATIVGTHTYSGTIDSITVRVSKDGVHPTEFTAELNGKNFTVEMTGLHPATTYQYYYAVDYGFAKPFTTETKTFTTLSESPTVRTIDVTKIDSTSIRVNCEALSDGGVEISERGVCWNTYGEPNLDDEVLAYSSAGLGPYSCRINNLALSTKYYVRAYAKNATGVGFGEVLEFSTGAATTVPEVSSVEIGEVTATSAVFTGNVAGDGGLDLEECGVCWSLNVNPTISGSYAAASQAALGVFQVSMTGLTPNKTYHARAYAMNAKGIAYGEDLTFTTTAGLPVVTTSGITEITATSAKGGGNVTDQGASNVTQRGVCWSTSHNPTTSSSHQAASTSGAGSFTVNMTGLTPNATYYVRAYATNVQGTSYGAEVSFTALEGLPVVTTQSVTDITSTTAKGHGTVTDQGGSTVTERGVCWGTSASPTISGNHASSGTGTGSFTVNLTNLTPGTKYYIRAYAKNTQGTVYGEQKDFTTSATLPTVTTASSSNVTSTTATGGGNVTTTGGATVTERGICWSTSHNPTTSSNHASSGTGTGSFTVNMTNLTPGTTYYVRAYAINSAGTAYGDEKSLTTTAVAPTVTTGQVSNITQTTAMGSGNVTASGGANVTERGVCWSTSHNPTISSSHQAASTSGTGSFTVNMTGLTANRHYYVRAYAKNSAGTSYGSEVDFTTSQSISAPTVTTSAVTDITETTATGGGNVTGDGGATVTERGICWSTNHNPTTSGSHATGGTGIGGFTVNMTGLADNTTYYVRAYAKNSAGTSYGSEVSFTTLQASIDWPNGTLPGAFSVNATQQVYFSQGNLQYKASTNTWRFAENQYDYIGSANSNISSTYSGYIDLFGWGTSGWNSGNTYYRPWDSDDSNGNLYGPPGQNNLTGSYANADWGVYNSVSNGGNQTGLWRTPTREEWSYLINTRSTNSGIRYALARVNNINGVVLLPDDWSTSYYTLSNTNQYNASFSSNTISASQWSTLEQHGAVFLPAAGSRGGTSVDFVGSYGRYWSASYSNSYGAWYVGLDCLETDFSNVRYDGLSVRLVRPTQINTPTVTTSAVTDITATAAVGGGNVTSDGGASVTERGVCWSINHNPTTASNHVSSGMGTGAFTANITSLTAGTTYFVRAYAINSAGTSYGNEVSFTTATAQAPIGAINGLFSVSDTEQVWFSQGNLQYKASSNTWRFAENQWDYVGEDNSNISSTYNGWIDLFGWGTSGYHDSSDPYNVNYQPWSISTSIVNESYNDYGYGPSTNMPSPDLTGSSANYDWGVYNPISNGGNQSGLWRTLTYEEWSYLFNTRSTNSGIRYAKAEVNNINGVILLPDDWSANYYALSSTNQSGASFNSNTITASQWNTLEQHGAVFLPAAGYRSGTSVDDVGSRGYYWSASYGNGYYAWRVYFGDGGLVTDNSGDRGYGFSVRLVRSS